MRVRTHIHRSVERIDAFTNGLWMCGEIDANLELGFFSPCAPSLARVARFVSFRRTRLAMRMRDGVTDAERTRVCDTFSVE